MDALEVAQKLADHVVRVLRVIHERYPEEARIEHAAHLADDVVRILGEIDTTETQPGPVGLTLAATPMVDGARPGTTSRDEFSS